MIVLLPSLPRKGKAGRAGERGGVGSIASAAAATAVTLGGHMCERDRERATNSRAGARYKDRRCGGLFSSPDLQSVKDLLGSIRIIDHLIDLMITYASRKVVYSVFDLPCTQER